MERLLEKFEFEDGVYFQKSLNRKNDFEEKYRMLREKEGRIYTDEEVQNLPEIKSGHPHRSEWLLRKNSMQRLLKYVQKKGFKNILDIGCGNGWMSKHLADTRAQVIALDINEFELKQGARVYSNKKNLQFVYADVLHHPFEKRSFDLIILSSSIQYFSDLKLLLEKLNELLSDDGEIHIIDSTIYNDHDALLARKRSEIYYNSLGYPGMASHYFHHSWSSLS
ncbi:MAG TPA: methyltransferase domain-containing protein, partial [Cyclobacteriaceae bacterium]